MFTLVAALAVEDEIVISQCLWDDVFWPDERAITRAEEAILHVISKDQLSLYGIYIFCR
jgi:hypothetical protein